MSPAGSTKHMGELCVADCLGRRSANSTQRGTDWLARTPRAILRPQILAQVGQPLLHSMQGALDMLRVAEGHITPHGVWA